MGNIRLEKREIPAWQKHSRDEAVQIAEHFFCDKSYAFFQELFDKVNSTYFDGQLMRPMITVNSGGAKNRGVGGFATKKMIYLEFITIYDTFLMLIHESMHLYQYQMKDPLSHIDKGHGGMFEEKAYEILEMIGIKDIKLSVTELKMFPHLTFEYYGIENYFKKCYDEFQELRPLPTGWKLERKEKPQQITEICECCDQLIRKG